jgi:hypothetical protein
MVKRGRHYLQVDQPLIVRFLTDGRPVRFWANNSKAIQQAMADLMSMENADSLPWMECGWRAFLESFDPGYASDQYAVARARLDFYEKIETSSRQMLADLNTMPENSILDFFRFFRELHRAVGAGGVLSVESPQQTVETLSHYDVDDQRLYAKYPLTILLLEKMLFDPDYLYTSPLDANSKREFVGFARFSQPDPPQVMQAEVQVDLPSGPKVDCPAAGGLVQSGFLFVECKPKPMEKASGAMRLREIREINPVILTALTVDAGTLIFSPPWAVLLFNAWTPQHTAVLRRLYPEENPSALRSRYIEVNSFGQTRSFDLPTSYSNGHDAKNSFFVSLFWRYVDGLLAPNLPVLRQRELPLANRVAAIGEFVRNESNSRQPLWTEGNALLSEAYAFYRARKPGVRLLLSPVTPALGGAVDGDRTATLPDGKSWIWQFDQGTSHLNEGISVRQPAPLPGYVLGGTLPGLGDEVFLLNLLRRGDQFYYFPIAW